MMNEKPWEIVGSCENFTSRSFGCYSSRGCAEQDAQRYRRALGTVNIHIRVIWNPPQG